MQRLITMPWGQRIQGRQKVKVTKGVAEPQGWTLQLHFFLASNSVSLCHQMALEGEPKVRRERTIFFLFFFSPTRVTPASLLVQKNNISNSSRAVLTNPG